MEKLSTNAAETEEALKKQQDLTEEIEKERQRLETLLAEERESAAIKYRKLEQESFEERELLLAEEEALKSDKERLQKECDEWRA